MSLLFDFKVAKAIEISRKFVEKYGKLYVMFSGGKDSLLCLDIVYRAVGRDGIKAVVFIEMVGNTDPIAVDFVYRTVRRYGLEDKLLHLRTPYDHLEIMKRRGFPSPWRKWCWGDKWKLVRGAVDPPYNWVVGIKASDSKYRASPKWNKYIVELPELGEYALQPIIEFTREDVWTYVKRYRLELNPCYEIYGCGGVCMFCPYRDASAIEKIMSNDYWCRKIVDVLLSIRSRSRFAVQILRRWLSRAKCLSDEEKTRILEDLKTRGV